MRPLLPLVLAALALSGLAAAQDPPSIVLVVVDDLGIDNVGYYRAHPRPARTPNIDLLAREGTVFWNTYANPVCTPSRVALMTGRFGSAPDILVGHSLKESHTLGGLDTSLASLPRALGPAYRRVALGKWHLSDGTQVTQATSPAVELGFDEHALTWFNLNQDGQGYYDYRVHHEDGGVEQLDRYATTEFVDRAIAELQDDSRPLFLYLALHAPHSPFEAPPAHLHGVDLTGADDELVYKAMVEALDRELGRFVAALDASPVGRNAVLLLLSDNGTPASVTTAPWESSHAKGSPYEGGVRVPFLVRGPGVVARRIEPLVSLVDVAPTILELAGGGDLRGDGRSLVPWLRGENPAWRPIVYSEKWHLNGFAVATQHERVARSMRYSVQAFHDRPDELYDLTADPLQRVNLLEQGPGVLGPEELRAYLGLRGFLDSVRPGFWQ